MHDPRLGRFFAVDPLASKYPHNSPYAFSENRVIDGVELEGLEVVLIHGTRQSDSRIFDTETVDQFMRVGGNTFADYKFSWGNLSKLTNSRHYERKIAASMLAIHVLNTRMRAISQGYISKDEPITLVGYSHGGNIAIQAADLIYENTGLKVQIITIATPAYNDGSVEDPGTKEGISKHIHLYSEFDEVDGYAGGNETYNNGSTVNYKMTEEYFKNNDGIGTHSDIGNKSKNSKLADFFRDKVGKMSDRKEFKKSK